MAEQRSPEQRVADDLLTEAVEQVMRAYDFLPEGHINTTYMVLVEQRGWRPDDGDESSGVCAVFKDGGLPWPTIFGLLRMATLRLERDWAVGDDD